MSRLYLEVLDKKRKAVFQKLTAFSNIGCLGGGTALSLLLRHRYSYDFDIFSLSPISPDLILSVEKVFGKNIQKLADSSSELSLLTEDKIKITFLHFPFPALHPPISSPGLPLFDLRDLASNKAYVVGRRGEYRDYVDLFFVLKSGLILKKIIIDARKRFAGGFSERLFLEQLVYFDDLKDLRVDFLGEQYSSEKILAFFRSEIKKKC